ncbi:MAG: 16S rRNA (guanine(527)-N(7))-methyltransferase RsmG [Deltaproteobacteria bacterium]|nr:16S rRNA (guanine(527)-N(7))-methyltransferase RsmG [Deltaproteobacteria bacterium]
MIAEPKRPPLALPEVTALAPPDTFAPALAALGVTLTEAQVTQLGRYLAYLLAMNEQMNLTAIVDPVEAWSRHVLDGLSLVVHLASVPERSRVADVGAGGGVPGIVLAIARPDLRFVLIEATLKKAAFLEALAKALSLGNVRVRPERAEVLGVGDMAESFDVVCARAVGKLEVLLVWTVPLAKPGAKLLFIKGQRADEELAAAQRVLVRLGCRHEETVQTPTGRVVVIRKPTELPRGRY